MSPSLVERFKTETRALHTAAERSPFMNLLLRGRMARPAYCALLRNLHVIYAALEPALERQAAHPLIGPICVPALWRTAALESDLQMLHGPGWSKEVMLQPATLHYATRLRDIEVSQPGLLLAHAYVRYLGDLSGGQMLRRIVANSLAADASGALAFYDFGDPQRTRELKQAFRAGLATAAGFAAQSDELVDEAKLSFALHQRLFDELALHCAIAEVQGPRPSP